MKQFIKLTFLLLSYCITNHVLAENLIDLYNLAKDNDPTIQAAYQDYNSQLEALPQARASLLPTINATSGSANNYCSTNSSTTPSNSSKYNSWSYGISMTQPIFQMDVWSKLSQAKDTVKKAFATLADAEQALLFRVSQQYFAILEAQDDLNCNTAAQKSFAKQLEQAKQRYKVGLIAITDVLVAQAAYDNAYALVIGAENDLATAKEELRKIVGKHILHFAQLKTTIKLPTPHPTNIKKWVQSAIEKNWSLQAARYDLAIAKKKIQQYRAGNYPTLGLNANANKAKNPTGAAQGEPTSRSVGLVFNLPLFSGGKIISQTRQASYAYEATKDKFEQTYRTTESKTRQAYNGVLTKLSQVKAFKQAVISNASALKSTEAAFAVGTKTIVDVVIAQSALTNAEKDYAKARCDYIIQSLTLKQVTGVLSVEDLQEINGWLQMGKK